MSDKDKKEEVDIEDLNSEKNDGEGKSSNKKKGSGSRIAIIILIIITILLLCVAGFLGAKYVKLMNASDSYKKLRKQVTVIDDDDDKSDVKADSEKASRTIDFSQLEAQNDDVIAWIKVPGTNVDYPVMMAQGNEDTDFYLMHNWDKSYGYPGCIYAEREQDKDFSNFNTILYGHDMKDKSMFSTLHNFYKEDFFKANKTFTIETKDKLYTYKIFAATLFDDRHLLKSYDYSTKEGREAFLSDIKNTKNDRTHYDDSVDVSADSRIVTLSTCTNSETSRFLVIGKLEKEQNLE